MGSIVLGFVSDRMYGKRSLVALVAVVCSMTLMYLITAILGIMTTFSFIGMMFFVGFILGGLANLMYYACSIDLGKQSGHQAVGTVTGIINGSGTLGVFFGLLVVR